MKVTVILAHPDKGSFNHAIAGAAIEILNTNGHEVAFHDLYKEKFPPILPAHEIPRGAFFTTDNKQALLRNFERGRNYHNSS